MLKGLLAALVIVAIAAGANGWLERSRRIAEAPAEVLFLDSYASPGKGAEGGVVVHYQFVVDGAAYAFHSFKKWSLATIHAAKVCYEPAQPRNQELVRERDSCG